MCFGTSNLQATTTGREKPLRKSINDFSFNISFSFWMMNEHNFISFFFGVRQRERVRERADLRKLLRVL